MPLNEKGLPIDEVISDLSAKRDRDVKWRDGKVFGLVFNGGPSVHEVAEKAASLYLHENALSTAAFPSLGEIQKEVVGWTGDLLHGDKETAGFMTSGGTESILCGVLAARDRAAKERGITEGEIVVAESAHAAFHKAAHLYGLKVRKTKVLDDWTADVEAMAAAVNTNTVLVVGSAPQFPQGVIDPIPEIAALAATVDANCHVDACMGGFVLPFAEMLGRPVKPWDFRVDGVHSISADIHKLGYAPKGASCILYRNKHYRKYQTFLFSDWLGGLYGSPNLQGSRSGLPMAAAWAVMRHLGVEGYKDLVKSTLENADAMRAGISAIEGLTLLGDPQYHLLAFMADPASEREIDVFALADALLKRGWYNDRQMPPDNLHATVSNSNAGVIDEYLHDLAECADEVAGRRSDDRSATYATIE